MNPPQKDAVARALSILMGSVNKENEAQFVFKENAAAFVPLTSLPDNVEALLLAKSCIDREFDTVISQMQHRRNLAAPIHRLPIEVLIMIFTELSAFSSLSDPNSLLDLSIVNKLWYDTIVHSPQLWTVLESDFTPKIARLVLQRSKNLPLSLIWDSTDYDQNDERELEEVLELAVQNSRRLKSIDVTFLERGTLNVRRLLESNMPHLDMLRVNGTWDPYPSGELVETFELSDGPPLREISLNKTSLSSWTSPRLSGLVVLDVTRPRRPPSTEELSFILSTSPQLERLNLREWRHNESFPSKLVSEPITLPHLKDIYVEDISGAYLIALLGSFYVPYSTSVSIKNTYYENITTALLEEMFKPGNDQLAALLGLANSEFPPTESSIPIIIVLGSDLLQIEKIGDDEERRISTRFVGNFASQAVGLLGQFFVALPQTPKIDMEIDTHASYWDNAELELLPWSRCLRSLSVHTAVVCRAVIRQLAERTVEPTTAVNIWVCPNLTCIRLCYMHPGDEIAELDGVALENLVCARWSGEGAAEQPMEFTIRCDDGAYPSIWSRADFLKQIIPCLSIDPE